MPALFLYFSSSIPTQNEGFFRNIFPLVPSRISLPKTRIPRSIASSKHRQCTIHGKRKPFQHWSLKIMGSCGGVVFLSTSTASSYCTIALPELKTTKYEASHTGKHCKRREIHNSSGYGVMEASTTRFFSSEI